LTRRPRTRTTHQAAKLGAAVQVDPWLTLLVLPPKRQPHGGKMFETPKIPSDQLAAAVFPRPSGQDAARCHPTKNSSRCPTPYLVLLLRGCRPARDGCLAALLSPKKNGLLADVREITRVANVQTPERSEKMTMVLENRAPGVLIDHDKTPCMMRPKQAHRIRPGRTGCSESCRED
jgi:hypothetical protein